MPSAAWWDRSRRHSGGCGSPLLSLDADPHHPVGRYRGAATSDDLRPNRHRLPCMHNGSWRI
jgi:hypothetical protein